mgnify:FL=1
MKNITQSQSSCKTTMKLLGDYWTLRIIEALGRHEGDGVRFCELQRSLDNVNPVTLTNRLKKLEQTKLVRRSHAAQDKISVSYALSSLGKDALTVIASLDAFAAKLSQ